MTDVPLLPGWRPATRDDVLAALKVRKLTSLMPLVPQAAWLEYCGWCDDTTPVQVFGAPQVIDYQARKGVPTSRKVFKAVALNVVWVDAGAWDAMRPKQMALPLVG